MPEELSVVGFDNSEQAALPYKRLTTLAQDPRQLAGTAVGMVLRRLETATSDPDSTANQVVLPTHLVQGASTSHATITV